MSIVTQTGAPRRRPKPSGSVAVCYRCSHVEEVGAVRCPRCGFALITEASGRRGVLPRGDGRYVPLPGMTPRALPEVPPPAYEIAVAEPPAPRRGWLGRLLRR